MCVFSVSSLCCLFLPAPGFVLVPMQMLVADPCGIAMHMAITVDRCEVGCCVLLALAPCSPPPLSAINAAADGES